MSPKKEKDEGEKNKEKKNFSDHVKEITQAIGKDAGEDLAALDLDEAPGGEQSCEEALRSELEESKAMAADYLDKLRRNMAEFDNFRKRTVKEKATMFDEGVIDVANRLIPIMDNFDLAVNASTNREDNFFKGVDLILRQFKNVFFDLGIEEIPALGQQFDPNLHNAVMHVTDDAFGTNEIIEEMRKGYKYKDRIIRHTMVKVAN